MDENLLNSLLSENRKLGRDVENLKKKCNYLKRTIRKFKQEQVIYERKRSVTGRKESEVKTSTPKGRS